MSATVTVARPRGRALSDTGRRLVAAVPADALALAFVFVVVAVVGAITWGTWGDPTMDTGYDLLAGARSAHGELPYADYTYYYGALSPLVVAPLFAVFGSSVGTAVALGWALTFAILGLTYALARVFTGPLVSGLATALVATAAVSSANNSYVLPHSFSAPLGILAVLVALLAAIAYARGGDRRWLVLAGVGGGLACLTHLEFAGPLGVALAGWLFLRLVSAPRGAQRRRALGDAAILIGVALAIPVAVYGFVLTQGVSLHDLLWRNLWPREELRQGGNAILKGVAPWTAGSIVKIAAETVAYAAGAAVLAGAGMAIARGGRVAKLTLAALAGAFLIFLAVLVARPETVRFYVKYAYAWIPAGAWLAVGFELVRFRRRDGAWPVADQAALVFVLFLALAATTLYAGFVPYANARHPGSATYYLPFAAVFLAWLHGRVLTGGRRELALVGAGWLAALVVANAALVGVDAARDSVTVRGPGGAIATEPADGLAYQGAVNAIDHLTRPGEPVLLPQMAWLYVVADRPDPIPQLTLQPGALPTVQAQRNAIAQMRDVRLAVTDRTPLTTYRQGAFGTTYAAEVAGWIHSHFRRVSTLRGTGPNARVLDVWWRDR